MRTACFFVFVVILSASQAWGEWVGSYSDLKGRPEYVASTDIGLAGATYYTAGSPGTDGGIGYQLSDFQLNLLYQAVGGKTIAETRTDIEAFDDWRYAPLGNYNFPDGEQYFLRIATGGGLPIGLYTETGQEFQSDSGASWVQWTISGWWGDVYHTILAGDIVGSDYLRVIGNYRSFGSEVNEVEFFAGDPLLCEIAGYTLDLPGLNLEANLIPEPATMTLLGLGLAGAALVRRRAGA